MLPRRLRHLDDLVARPRPNKLNKSEDFGNAPFHELLGLAGDLFHGPKLLAPALANSFNKMTCGTHLGKYGSADRLVKPLSC